MRTIAILILGGAFLFASCNVPGTGKPKLTNETDTISYALGVVVANGFISQLQQQKGMFDTIDYKMMAKAFSKSIVQKEYLDYIKPQLDSISAEKFMNGYLNQLAYGKNGVFNEMTADGLLRTKNGKVRERLDVDAKVKAQKNLEDGQRFLDENKSKAGVIITESGLQYQIITEGTGPKPVITDKVSCVYHGTLLDGTVFDSSKERGDTATFNVNGVVQGWQEALPMMSAGSKWKLFIPANLAYGDRGQGKIGPNSTLIFEIELISVVK